MYHFLTISRSNQGRHHVTFVTSGVPVFEFFESILMVFYSLQSFNILVSVSTMNYERKFEALFLTYYSSEDRKGNDNELTSRCREKKSRHPSYEKKKEKQTQNYIKK